MLSKNYLQEVIKNKDQELDLGEANEHNVVVSWAICDGALVVHDCDSPPDWFKFERDDDGNSISEPLTPEEAQAIRLALAFGDDGSSSSDDPLERGKVKLRRIEMREMLAR